ADVQVQAELRLGPVLVDGVPRVRERVGQVRDFEQPVQLWYDEQARHRIFHEGAPRVEHELGLANLDVDVVETSTLELVGQALDRRPHGEGFLDRVPERRVVVLQGVLSEQIQYLLVRPAERQAYQRLPFAVEKLRHGSKEPA